VSSTEKNPIARDLLIRRPPSLATFFALVACGLALPVELSAAAVVGPLATVATQQRPGARGRGPASSGREPSREAQERGESNGPEYSDVIPEDAVTKRGMFDVHEVDDDLFFEIPVRELDREMVLIKRTVETTLQDPGDAFLGGPSVILQWERDDDRILLRQKRYNLIADTTAAVWGVVQGFRRGAILATFDIEVFGPDSSAVIDVSNLFLSSIPEFDAIDGLQGSRSWVERTASFDDAVNVQVVQSGRAAPPGGRGGGRGSARSQTETVLFSMARLPEEPMMPRWNDERVGFLSSSSWDFARPDNRLERVRMIHRHRLEKLSPDDDVSNPVEPIIYWIDPATPEWLQPWIVKGVNAWQPVFEGAGFSNAIEGRIAPTPEEDPDFSLFDVRNSAIYWRPSTRPNADGGQVVDPRSGEILKGEVNMYHNVMQLQRDWYLIQVGPLDERAQSLPLPDSLMGRLVEFVVTHEVGHAIGFPHNFKASSMYPADSLRSRSFQEAMGGSHVATLMDYSRFNYVAQPEDSIPPEYLIPKVGPYDYFAVHWGYAPIPEASTPDEERPILDEWAREQDEYPWLRFTTADARGTDPGALTEAVGDADAVKSTTYGMRNLERVMDMLLDITERPGESYDQLQSLYGEAVAQWGRYMGHVTAIVGGAYSQERYGTGPRFEPVARERQREAVTYLGEAAFRVPEMFLDQDILRRIEPQGVVARFRTQQARVLDGLLSQSRLERLIEFEAMADAPADAYTLADLMDDLRDGVWGELDESSVRVNTYRRNVQRAFLDAVDRRLDPEDTGPGNNGPWASDIRAVLRAELAQLDELAEGALERPADAMTRIHLRDVRSEIARITNPS
jgi:hypothetical protein